MYDIYMFPGWDMICVPCALSTVNLAILMCLPLLSLFTENEVDFERPKSLLTFWRCLCFLQQILKHVWAHQRRFELLQEATASFPHAQTEAERPTPGDINAINSTETKVKY